MSDKRLSLLAVAAIASVVLAGLVLHLSNKTAPAASGAGYLIQGLDPALIAEIASVKGDEKINLVRRADGFAVAQKAYYPAMTKEINELITACLDMKILELYTEDKTNHKDLEVTEEDAFGIIKFLGSDGKLITGVVIGKSNAGGNSYARLIDSDKVYLVEKAPWVKPAGMDFIDSELIYADRDKIASVTVTLPDGSYTIAADGGKAVLQQLPDGKQQKDDAVNAVFYALANLRFDDVNTVTDGLDLNFDIQYECLLTDSTLYTISIAQKDEKTYAKCTAEFTDKTPVQKAEGVESEEELKKKEAKLVAKENAKKFELKCKDWIYQLPNYQAENMLKPLSELLEDIPTEPADANEG